VGFVWVDYAGFVGILLGLFGLFLWVVCGCT
jgi:hypothetical protein